MQTTGWLFDLYPLQDRLVLWFITDAGQRVRLEDEFPYRVYLGGPWSRLRALARAAAGRGWLRRAYPARGRDLWSGKEIPVMALELRGYGFLPRLRNWLGALPEAIACYHCDLDISSYYLYTRRLWPCAWYDLEATQGQLLKIVPREEAFALEFAAPPLAVLTLGLTRDPLIPLGAGNGILLEWEGRTFELEAQDAPGLLSELSRWLRRADPDLVLSDWGDEEIIPPLWRWSQDLRIPLPLDRETRPVPRKFRGSRSYFSYGRIVYQGAAAPFFGRWHVDRRNSFYYRESGLPGLMQIARLGQMPLQQAARASPGTLITSMQLARAIADGILIPWRKGKPEHFKTAGELLIIDKGGLSFMPPPGLHTQVAEVDFSSMYPTIMTIHNISPETVNCSCCAAMAGARGQGPGASGFSVRTGVVGAQLAGPAPAGRVYVEQPLSAVVGATRRVAPTYPNNLLVPEAGYRLCRRREGLVPRTLRPILQLRERLKTRAKEVRPPEAGPYQQRQNALKWMLVTCFGYLGYKNARFGRIEAHEAVTAYGRDKLLTAKEVFEAAGYRVLHGLTDCLWVQKAELTDTGWREIDPNFAGTGVSPAPPRLNVHGRFGPPPKIKISCRGGSRADLAETYMVNGKEPPLLCLREWKTPLPPFIKGGVKKSPFGKGGFMGILVSTAKPAATQNDFLNANRYEVELEELCKKISIATGVKLALEGVYRWICFMPSKQDPRRPVATRYFGVFADGSLKVRGLACRRRDTPPFVRRAQEALLAKMAQAATVEDLAALHSELEEMAAGFRQRLREGSVTPQDLVITRVLSQKAEEYKVDTPTALAARQLKAAGIELHPGEKVRYVHREPKGGPKECRIAVAPFLETLEDYDAAHYLELLNRALEEVLLPFGER